MDSLDKIMSGVFAFVGGFLIGYFFMLGFLVFLLMMVGDFSAERESGADCPIPGPQQP